MFGKKVKTENVSKENTDSVNTSPIPFLEREKPITDLESLALRVELLYVQIKKSKENILELEYKIKKLEEGISSIKIITTYDVFTLYHKDYLEIIDTWKLEIIGAWKSEIQREKDLIHTCQDELDWLQMKVAIGPNIRKNRFESGDFNFDPNKDHC